MDDLSNQKQAVELLQQLGLKEYEAKAFVALSRLSAGTAKTVSDVSEVPRTRVYDAIRVLETKGLVEVQHSNPQQFRAVSIDEAAETLRTEYESRTDRLAETLSGLDPAPVDDGERDTHEIWALSGEQGITNRTQQLLEEADTEVVFVIGHESVVTESLVEHVRTAQDRGVTVILGTINDELKTQVQATLPDANVFVSGLEWLQGAPLADDETEIGRLLLVDRTTILVSTFHASATGARTEEQAVFGRGFDNGIVAIARRLMATGLLTDEDPGAVDAAGE